MANFIVDTSVWIDFFRGKLARDPLQFLIEGIEHRIAGLTDVIRHEILVGALNDRDFNRLRGLLGPLESARIADLELEDFDRFSWQLRISGFRGKYTDASIAFVCHRDKIPLMTFDRYFGLLAKKNLIRLVSF